MTKEEFRQAILERRPDLKGKLRFNKTDRYGWYTVTVTGMMTVSAFHPDHELPEALLGFFGELGHWEDLVFNSEHARRNRFQNG